MLPINIQLTSYIISYNVTDAFNQESDASIIIPGEDNNYVFNAICSYETGVSLCPASHYCFILRGVYYNDSTAIKTAPTNKICFNTSKYRKYKILIYNSKMCYNFLHSPVCIIYEYQVQCH